MFQHPANVVQSCFRQSCVAIAREQRLVAFPERLVTMHPRSVVPKKRLRHERRSLAVPERGVLYDVLEDLQVVSGAQQIRKAEIDFALTGSSNFVVQTLN